jgi:hypothetical protein
MLTIHKFAFDASDYVTIQMPRGAVILHVECQCGVPCIWALVDTDKPSVDERFRVFGTGHMIEGVGNHAASSHVASFRQGPFVWHLFRARESDPTQAQTVHD